MQMINEMTSGVLNGLRRRFPVLWRAMRSVKYPDQLLGRSESVFTRIHRENFWEARESRSGPGSTLEQTAKLRSELPRIFRDLGIRSLLDLPCGDFNWMSHLNYSFDWYIGGDIVRSVVEQNQEKFGSSVRRFEHLDILRDDLPPADAIFTRDCLVHFSDSDVRKALANLQRASATYLIATTYPGRGPSINIITGEWQPLDLEDGPFFLPAPLTTVNEGHRERDGSESRKSLGIWRLADLRGYARA